MGLSIRATLRRLTATAVLAAAYAAAQAPVPVTTLVEPPTPLLPTDATLVAPTADLPVPDDNSETQAILKEDGLVRMESRVKLVPTASKPVSSGWIKAYQFVDATGAYSAYTYLRQGGVRPSGGARVNDTDVQIPSGERVILSGTSVVRAQIKQYPESLLSLLHSVAVGLPKVSGRKGIAPTLPSLFPGDVSGTKLDPATIRYSLGPIAYKTLGGQLPPDMLGWDKSAEIATATYSGKQGKGTLTLLLFPTPQIAGDHGRAIEKAINDAGAASFGTVKLRRNGPLLSLATGGFNPDQAENLVQAVHLNEEVTFDQKLPLEFHAEVRKTATLLESILIFTGLATIAAVVIAVFLGGIRAGWRVMHGKPAASEPEFLTINLRGVPKGLFVPREPDPDDPTP
jgi:hypothetical protein